MTLKEKQHHIWKSLIKNNDDKLDVFHLEVSICIVRRSSDHVKLINIITTKWKEQIFQVMQQYQRAGWNV